MGSRQSHLCAPDQDLPGEGGWQALAASRAAVLTPHTTSFWHTWTSWGGQVGKTTQRPPSLWAQAGPWLLHLLPSDNLDFDHYQFQLPLDPSTQLSLAPGIPSPQRHLSPPGAQPRNWGPIPASSLPLPHDTWTVPAPASLPSPSLPSLPPDLPPSKVSLLQENKAQAPS